jgi:poly(3-hydroxybutyrate) depolymerase
LALVEAVSFEVSNRANGSFVSSGEAGIPVVCPTELRPSQAGGARHQSARRDDVGPRSGETASGALAEAGFLVVYPSGITGSGPRHWRVERGDGLRKDVRFVAELIDRLEAEYNIDPARIYANGLSNGGGMAFVLSCTLSDRIAGVGMVAAAQSLPWEWCTDRRAVPMMAFHGTADWQMPYYGGAPGIGSGEFPKVSTWAAKWARRNRCSNRPVDSEVAAGVTRRAFTGCADSADVVLYTIRRWPYLAGRQAAAGVVERADQRPHRRHEEMWSSFARTRCRCRPARVRSFAGTEAYGAAVEPPP